VGEQWVTGFETVGDGSEGKPAGHLAGRAEAGHRLIAEFTDRDADEPDG